MKRSRAYRRHQHWRAVARAKRFLRDVVHWDYREDPEIYSRHVYLYTTDRKPCSCYICSGNKREEHKWERRQTKQELRKSVEEDIVCPNRKYSW